MPGHGEGQAPVDHLTTRAPGLRPWPWGRRPASAPCPATRPGPSAGGARNRPARPAAPRRARPGRTRRSHSRRYGRVVCQPDPGSTGLPLHSGSCCGVAPTHRANPIIWAGRRWGRCLWIWSCGAGGRSMGPGPVCCRNTNAYPQTMLFPFPQPSDPLYLPLSDIPPPYVFDAMREGNPPIDEVARIAGVS